MKEEEGALESQTPEFLFLAAIFLIYRCLTNMIDIVGNRLEPNERNDLVQFGSGYPLLLKTG